MNMQNELSIFVQGIVFFQIADPVQELKKAFGTNSKKPVAVLEATSSSAIILIPGFATVSNAGRHRRLSHLWCPLKKPGRS